MLKWTVPPFTHFYDIFAQIPQKVSVLYEETSDFKFACASFCSFLRDICSNSKKMREIGILKIPNLQNHCDFIVFSGEARRGPERPREPPRGAQRGPERPREAQRGPESPRETQRGPESPRE